MTALLAKLEAGGMREYKELGSIPEKAQSGRPQEPPSPTLADYDAVRAAMIQSGSYRGDVGYVAASVDVLARNAIIALTNRGWRPALSAESMVSPLGGEKAGNSGTNK